MRNLQAPQTHTPHPQGQPQYGEPHEQYAAQYAPPYGQPYGPAQPMTAAEAAAQAKAAKAHAKRLRPWFKKKRFVAPLSLVALITVVTLANGGDTTTSATPAATPSAPAAAKAAPTPAAKPATTADPKAAEATRATKPAADPPASATIGTAVTSGDFEVTITRVRPGVKSVGTEFLSEKAQGRYVLVDLKATNSGDEAHYLLGSDITLLDARGREFSVDEMASIYVSDNNPLLEEINPGNTSKGTLVFDLPKGVKATQAQISAGGLFDGPTVVNLAR